MPTLYLQVALFLGGRSNGHVWLRDNIKVPTTFELNVGSFRGLGETGTVEEMIFRDWGAELKKDCQIEN